MTDIIPNSDQFPTVATVVKWPATPSAYGVYSAVLTPNRSLTRRGYRALLAVVLIVNLSFAGLFLSVGAPAMVLFTVIGFTAVWLAFEVNFLAARQFERVDLCDELVRIVRVTPKGEVTVWTANPFWTRLETHKVGEPGGELSLITKNRRISLGTFMPPPERERFAGVLSGRLNDVVRSV